MISVYEYAQLSGHIYKINEGFYGRTEFQKGSIKNLASNVNGWYHMADVESNMISSNHFFAQLYIKFRIGEAIEAVIVVRGTQFGYISNDSIDLLSWWSDVLGNGGHEIAPLFYTNDLVSYTHKAYRYIRRHFPNITRLKFTGHSLGGALAQLMPLKTGFPGETVVFNSPGVGHIPGVELSQAGWVTLVNSRYGFINKISINVNTPLIVDVPNMEAEAKAIFMVADIKDFNLSQSLYGAADKLVYQKLAKQILSNRGDLANSLDHEAFFLQIKALGSDLASATEVYNRLFQTEPINNGGQNEESWINLKKRLAAQVYFYAGLGSNLVKLIKAQHSIDNMVQALQNEQNAAIAYKII